MAFSSATWDDLDPGGLHLLDVGLGVVDAGGRIDGVVDDVVALELGRLLVAEPGGRDAGDVADDDAHLGVGRVQVLGRPPEGGVVVLDGVGLGLDLEGGGHGLGRVVIGGDLGKPELEPGGDGGGVERLAVAHQGEVGGARGQSLLGHVEQG
jgi:hypothetical protein